ncbi:phage tail protein [Streptomyces calidiresistens]|uniref:Phage tail protein n=2 Tax=Streptomyces TaxID=1883 RepID=A0A7W3TEB2_9ACTN|nr:MULTISPECIES: phage tail protein [Streptomyces]MBB0231062.1 phage tail protein [Streptomyces calidiresistens]MBB0244950.1 phage tail protein [Streptomyces alkaliphilus]
MALEQGDALTVHNFGIQIDGILVDTIHEISDFTYELEVITYTQNTADGGAPLTKNMPGIAKGGSLSVVYGANTDKVFTDWVSDSIAGDMGQARKDASVILMDYQRNPVRRYNLRNAWCHKVAPSSLTAGDASPLTETVTITFEELVIE